MSDCMSDEPADVEKVQNSPKNTEDVQNTTATMTNDIEILDGTIEKIPESSDNEVCVKTKSVDMENETKSSQTRNISSPEKQEIAIAAETSLTIKPNESEPQENTTKAVTTTVEAVEKCHSENTPKDDDIVKENIAEENKMCPIEINEKPTSAKDDKTLSEEEKSSSHVPSKDIDYAKHVTYKDDGSAIYTDPQTKYQYQWCTDSNNWKPYGATTAAIYENEHYKWCQTTQKWIPKQTLVTETEHYKWDADKNEWIPKAKQDIKNTETTKVTYDIDEDGKRTYKDKDGTVFFWDDEKNAWFPKIDEDFMAQYQMNYGFIDNTSEANKEKEEAQNKEIKRKKEELQKLTQEAITNDEAFKDTTATGVKRKAQQEPPKWFEIDPSHNTKVYVSNLPLDITLDEFTELMSKCGMIMRDPVSQKFKLKLYTEEDGQIKGDGLCDYIKVESVDLALQILDEYNLRGNKLHVQPAQFQMRGEYNPALKPKRKKKDKEKLAKIKEKLFDWRPEKMRGERSKNERTVIIKNLFQPELFEKEVTLILDYQNDLREECSKCGTVKKVIIYDRHSEGVAQVNMSSPEEADVVIQMMQGRYFGKRQLIAEHWDGKTKYKTDETEEETQKRLSKWDRYLETSEIPATTTTSVDDP